MQLSGTPPTHVQAQAHTCISTRNTAVTMADEPARPTWRGICVAHMTSNSNSSSNEAHRLFCCCYPTHAHLCRTAAGTRGSEAADAPLAPATCEHVRTRTPCEARPINYAARPAAARACHVLMEPLDGRPHEADAAAVPAQPPRLRYDHAADHQAGARTRPGARPSPTASCS
jgi:hypothetical protein